jgi:hypothetical protein
LPPIEAWTAIYIRRDSNLSVMTLTGETIQKPVAEPPPRSRQVCVIVGTNPQNSAYVKGVALRAAHVFKRSGKLKYRPGYLRIARRQARVNGRASVVLFLRKEFPFLNGSKGAVLEMDSFEVQNSVRGIATQSVPSVLQPKALR